HGIAHGKRLALLGAFGLQRWNIRRGRRRRSREQVLEHPFPSYYRRRAGGVRGDRQKTSLPEQAAARAVRRKTDLTEIASLHVGYSVVLRQPLVDEGVVRRDEFEHAAF